MTDCVFVKDSVEELTAVIFLPFLHTSSTSGRAGFPDQQSRHRALGGMPQRHTPRAASSTRELSQVHEVGASRDCDERQNRKRDRGRSQPLAQKEPGRTAPCTTTTQSGHGPRPGEPGRNQTCSGCGRSMAEAVTALGPTRLQHCASCAGAHACAKAVLTGFASVVGLKGALHGASCGTSSGWSTRSIRRSCASGTRRTSSTG